MTTKSRATVTLPSLTTYRCCSLCLDEVRALVFGIGECMRICVIVENWQFHAVSIQSNSFNALQDIKDSLTVCLIDLDTFHDHRHAIECIEEIARDWVVMTGNGKRKRSFTLSDCCNPDWMAPLPLFLPTPNNSQYARQAKTLISCSNASMQVQQITCWNPCA